MNYLLKAFLLLSFYIQTAASEDLKIPVMVGQTGASATFGKGELDAYTLAVEEWNARGGVNGRRVALEVEDTQTNQRQIVTAFHSIVARTKPSVILGPTWLDGFPAIISIARQKEVLLVTPSAANEAFSEGDRDWPVTFYHNSTIETQSLVDGLKERGHKRIALIYEQEPFAEMIRTLVSKSISELVADIGVQAGDADFHAILTRLKTKTPDALIIFVWDEKALLSLLQQLRQHLPQLQLATVHDGQGWLANPAFQAALPRLVFSKFVVADSTFQERFKRRFGYEPMLTASNAYDALSAVLSARAAGKETAKDIRQYLMTQSLDTVTFGKFQFAANGNVPSKVVVVDFPAKN